MNDDIVIGVLNDYDHADIVTIKELNEHAKDPLCVYSLEQYYDCRCGTDLTRFVYDPFTAREIEWNKLKKEYTKT